MVSTISVNVVVVIMDTIVDDYFDGNHYWERNNSPSVYFNHDTYFYL